MPRLCFGSFTLLPGEQRLLRDGTEVALGARAFGVLCALATRPGQVVSKDELLSIVWRARVVEEANLHTQVSLLRKAIGAGAIATVSGEGYRFVWPVVEGDGEPATGPASTGVNASSPVRNMRDLIELGKTQRITFGHWAVGSHPQMMAQQLAKRYGLDVEPVPYKGEAAMWLGLASGEITVALGSALGMSPHLQSGRVRAIAVNTKGRSPLLPQVPTFDEQGVADPVFTVQGSMGLLAPGGTPTAVIQRLSDLVQDAAATARVREINKTFGMPEKPWTAAELARIDGVNKPIWIALAQELNITLD